MANSEPSTGQGKQQPVGSGKKDQGVQAPTGQDAASDAGHKQKPGQSGNKNQLR